jgi:hypothetical protein
VGNPREANDAGKRLSGDLQSLAVDTQKKRLNLFDKLLLALYKYTVG